LKARYLGLIIVAGVFLIAAFFIDQADLLPGKVQPTNGTSVSASPKSNTLRTCDPTHASYLGPLVPDQNTAILNNGSTDLSSNETVIKSARSTRAGFSISTPTDPEYWAEMLGSGWYVDWSVKPVPESNNLEYWPMVRVHEDCISPGLEEIQSVASNNPGQVWIIGNEPDVIWQDNVQASRYATIYHDLYKVIKTSDPTALIAVGGVSQATPLRLQYLDQVLQTYQTLYHKPMPVDWWTVHGYVLREEKGSWGVDIPPGIDTTQGALREVKDHGRIDLFEAQLRSFRQWLTDHGYQHTPLALTEFGILMPSSYGFPDDVIADYLQQTFTWLSQVQDESIGYPDDGYHLVQKWAWFSLSDPTYSTSNLGNLSNGKLTNIGERFRSIVSTLVP
jgi:hypothetical protein